jgi:lysyl-tRNA synthetase class 2
VSGARHAAGGAGRIPWPLRVALVDAALSAVRTWARSSGMREVMTPVCGPAVALEPWIEPVALPPQPGLAPQWFRTSPELAMKQLLCWGAGSIVQIAAVQRAGERGRHHAPEFVLVEWYRVDADDGALRADVAAIVAAVAHAVAPLLAAAGRTIPAVAVGEWTTVRWLELCAATSGVVLRGDEGPAALHRAIAAGLRPTDADDPAGVAALLAGIAAAPEDPVGVLDAWTAWFSWWSDARLDPWLARERGAGGTHVIDFPRPLAALAQAQLDGEGRAVSGRFESHVGRVELANGYLELRDAAEQRARFDTVARWRAWRGLPPLPLDEAFLAALTDPGLPRCAGAALGLDRLLALVCGADAIADVRLDPWDSGGALGAT